VLLRPALCTSFLLVGMTACGGIGLAPINGGTDGYATVLDQAAGAGAQPVDAVLTGRTYSTPIADLTVLEPAGLQVLLTDASQGELLFHVADEQAAELDIVMTLSTSGGDQDPCQAVYTLPGADWSTNPEFSIQDGTTEIDVAGQPLALHHMDLDGRISTDGDLWESAILTAVIDTRDLLGGSLPQDTDVCALVEQLGGTCQTCTDGVDACATLQLEMDATRVDMDFDMAAGGC